MLWWSGTANQIENLEAKAEKLDKQDERMGYNTKYYKKPKPLSHISPKPLNHTIFQNYLPLQLTETSKYYNPNH